ncbi:MAG: HD domain-containing protein, partial [Clostridiales bacterium]|nr:HD domain-containing protein [Candidatus Blautia equi]
MGRINRLYRRMVTYYQGEPQQVQHFAKVYSFAKLISEEEGMEEHARYILEAAALVHDIGIKPAMEKYGKSDGKLQEQEGPAEAEKRLQELGFHKDVVERVSYLVGHHHTYQDIDG